MTGFEVGRVALRAPELVRTLDNRIHRTPRPEKQPSFRWSLSSRSAPARRSAACAERRALPHKPRV